MSDIDRELQELIGDHISDIDRELQELKKKLADKNGQLDYGKILSDLKTLHVYRRYRDLESLGRLGPDRGDPSLLIMFFAISGLGLILCTWHAIRDLVNEPTWLNFLEVAFPVALFIFALCLYRMAVRRLKEHQKFILTLERRLFKVEKKMENKDKEGENEKPQE